MTRFLKCSCVLKAVGLLACGGKVSLLGVADAAISVQPGRDGSVVTPPRDSGVWAVDAFVTPPSDAWVGAPDSVVPTADAVSPPPVRDATVGPKDAVAPPPYDGPVTRPDAVSPPGQDATVGPKDAVAPPPIDSGCQPIPGVGACNAGYVDCAGSVCATPGNVCCAPQGGGQRRRGLPARRRDVQRQLVGVQPGARLRVGRGLLPRDLQHHARVRSGHRV